MPCLVRMCLRQEYRKLDLLLLAGSDILVSTTTLPKHGLKSRCMQSNLGLQMAMFTKPMLLFSQLLTQWYSTTSLTTASQHLETSSQYITGVALHR